jgi:hypothetical protein
MELSRDELNQLYNMRAEAMKCLDGMNNREAYLEGDEFSSERFLLSSSAHNLGKLLCCIDRRLEILCELFMTEAGQQGPRIYTGEDNG